jgi:hypothetical protein
MRKTLTVNYQANEINTGITSPSTVNINSGGVEFSPKSATTNGSNVTTTYNTNPNSNFNVPINGNAVSTGSSSGVDDTITLKSLSLVGNSLTATYALTSNLPDNTALAPHNVPVENQATVSISAPSSVNNAGAGFNTRGVSSIGDVLAASSGITFNGTLTGALQQPPTASQTTSVPPTNAALAAVLNPNLNLSPSTSLQVTDFIDTSLNAFPTSAPSDTFSNPSNNNTDNSPSNTTNSNSTFESQRANSTSSSDSFTSQSNSASDNSSQVGIYNAVSNANASTIRGTGVNTVA